ncbi:MAG: efflux RND transporter periplasmic adaptor subunit [Phycisphaerales bacterium]
MIELSSLIAPGWQRVVAELSADCPDDKTYLERMLRVIAKVSAARQAVVFLPGGDAPADGPRPLCLWPAPGPGGEERVCPPSDVAVIEFAADARAAAAAALESGHSRAFGLDRKSALYGVESPEGYILAVPLPGAEGKPAAAISLLIEQRGKQAVQSTLAMADVLAGYVIGHAARQQLRRTHNAALAMDLATRLIAALNGAPNFKGAALQLVNDLAKQFKAERVALGWVRRDTVKVKAMSDVEHFDRRMAMVQRLESAMDECLDQEQPVIFPAPPVETDILLAQAITHAHRELASSSASTGPLRICSVPLREGENVVGVVTMELAGDAPLDLNAVELFQAAMDLVAPVLAVRRSDDRNLALRAWDDLIKAGAWAVGPKHTVWKLVAVIACAALLFVSFYTINYRVGADATLQPRTRHVISVPFEGLIRHVPAGVEAGALVKKGDLLAQMDVTEWELTAAEARQKIAQAQTDLRIARAEGKPGEAEKALAAEEMARAALTSAEEKIRRAKIIAPLDGTILAGRLQDRVGSSVKTGDRLFEVAPLDDIVAVSRVDERDIAMIRPGTKGQVATRSHPGEPLDFVVESIVPLAQADEGKNLFEVRAKLTSRPPIWLRPGMEGISKLETEDRSLLYIGTRRIADAVRLWIW